MFFQEKELSQTLADGAMRVLAGTEGVRGGGQSIKRVSIVGPNLIDLLPPAIERRWGPVHGR